MKELVIFSSPLLSILIVLTVVLHIAGVAIRKLITVNDVVAKKVGAAVAIVNMAVHVAIFVVCIVISASPQEMLFITMLSTAVAMAATNFGREE
jgi:hypothetical protein